jgi:hypothetical protein
MGKNWKKRLKTNNISGKSLNIEKKHHLSIRNKENKMVKSTEAKFSRTILLPQEALT